MDVTRGSLKEGRGKEENVWDLKMVKRFQAILYNATGASVSFLISTMHLISQPNGCVGPCLCPHGRVGWSILVAGVWAGWRQGDTEKDKSSTEAWCSSFLQEWWDFSLGMRWRREGAVSHVPQTLPQLLVPPARPALCTSLHARGGDHLFE